MGNANTCQWVAETASCLKNTWLCCLDALSSQNQCTAYVLGASDVVKHIHLQKFDEAYTGTDQITHDRVKLPNKSFHGRHFTDSIYTFPPGPAPYLS